MSKSLKNISLDLRFDGENKSHTAKFTRNILVTGAPISIHNYNIFSGLIFEDVCSLKTNLLNFADNILTGFHKHSK